MKTGLNIYYNRLVEVVKNELQLEIGKKNLKISWEHKLGFSPKRNLTNGKQNLLEKQIIRTFHSELNFPSTLLLIFFLGLQFSKHIVVIIWLFKKFSGQVWFRLGSNPACCMSWVAMVKIYRSGPNWKVVNASSSIDHTAKRIRRCEFLHEMLRNIICFTYIFPLKFFKDSVIVTHILETIVHGCLRNTEYNPLLVFP